MLQQPCPQISKLDCYGLPWIVDLDFFNSKKIFSSMILGTAPEVTQHRME